MAAYAALCSLMHIIEQIERHPYPPISLDKEQVEAITEKITFLQTFLEGYSQLVGYSEEADPLETRITDAVYAAEDLIESHIVGQIYGEEISCIDLYRSLHDVIEDMDSIKKEVRKMKENTGVEDLQLNRISSISGGSIRPHSTGQRTMVGFGDVLNEALEKLVGGQPDRRIIPIVGMGGIGKTTLARNLYEKKVVVEHFDIRVWVTISQVYSVREILLKVLEEIEGSKRQMNEVQLGEKIYRHLYGRRYLVVVDDIWDIRAWDQMKFYFPDTRIGSRIMVTTRLSMLAFELCGTSGINLELLDEHDSWDLFCECVCAEEDCPPELEDIGWQIAESCQGLPLSIVVIGGILAKSTKTRQHWEYISENLNSMVNLEANERCIQLLHLSYRNLPVYLKPCFLYMGVFREDSEIRVSKLVKLWVAEGFVKPIDGKSLEEVAEEYLEELVGRNLIMVKKCNNLKKVKRCKIHDLLRDLCLREARKQKFLCVVEEHSLNIPQDLNTERRICSHRHRLNKEYPPQFVDALQSASCARSLIWESEGPNYLPSFSSGLSRVSSVVNHNWTYLEAILQQVNLRYLYVKAHLYYDVTSDLSRFPSSLSLLWNLQTLTVGC